MQNLRFLFSSNVNVLKNLALITYLLILVDQSYAFEKCYVASSLGANEQLIECSPSKPYCCDSGTSDARCCDKKSSALINTSLTLLGIFSVVFAAILCTGCGGKKETGQQGDPQAQSPPPDQQATPAENDVKKSQLEMPKSNVGATSEASKPDKSKLDSKSPSAVEMASAISALDSKQPSAINSTLESKASTMASRLSGTGSTIGTSNMGSSKMGSALDSRASQASSTGSSLDSKLSSTAASTVGNSNIDSRASNAGSTMGSNIESRSSNVNASKSGFSSATGSNIDSRISGTGSTINKSSKM